MYNKDSSETVFNLVIDSLSCTLGIRCHADQQGVMQIGIFPGHMAKICPHTSTGRADYFGPAVNRAARLLCAAKGGQILVRCTYTDVTSGVTACCLFLCLVTAVMFIIIDSAATCCLRLSDWQLIINYGKCSVTGKAVLGLFTKFSHKFARTTCPFVELWAVQPCIASRGARAKALSKTIHIRSGSCIDMAASVAYTCS